MEIFYLVLIGLSAGMVKGTSGFGSSLVAVPLLFLVGFDKTEIVTMLITTNIAMNIMLMYENKKYFHVNTIKKIYPIILGGVIFTGIGLFIIFNVSVNKYMVEFIAGVLIVVAIFNKITSMELKLKENFISLFTVGIFSGLGNGLASIDGPPVVFYLLGINTGKEKFKSTLAVHFFIMGIAGVLILIFSGAYANVLLPTLYLFLAMTVGLIMGMIVSKKLNEEVFEKVILVVLIGLAVSLFIP